MPIQHSLSRRDLLIGGGVVGASVVAASIFAGRTLLGEAPPAPTDTAAPQPMLTYQSTSLTIPKTTSRTTGTTGDGLLFIDPQVKEPKAFRGLIMTDAGEPVWIEPSGLNLTDIRVQSYRGKPVITYWDGISVGGHGSGVGMILDSSYRPVHQVSAGNGLRSDLHEFNLTDRGTALVTCYDTVNCDLSSIGGPADGYIFNCHAQEIDIATGKVLIDWNVLDHVGIAETYLGLDQDKGHDGTTPKRAFDAFHINSIDDDGDALLISLRHTHTVYSLDRSTGAIRWRFGGKHSDFLVEPDAVFAWQHNARRHGDGTISLFDNHLYDDKDGGHSRGLVFSLNEKTRTATLERVYSHNDHLGIAMGSVQLLDNGNVLVGWGTDPALTEFTADRQVVYEATLGGMSYRANRSPWVGHPASDPDVAVHQGKNGTLTVYASWNGATEVVKWRVLTGTSAKALVPQVTAKRSGFESAIPVGGAPLVAVQALDASGTVLATSPTAVGTPRE